MHFVPVVFTAERTNQCALNVFWTDNWLPVFCVNCVFLRGVTLVFWLLVCCFVKAADLLAGWLSVCRLLKTLQTRLRGAKDHCRPVGGVAGSIRLLLPSGGRTQVLAASGLEPQTLFFSPFIFLFLIHFSLCLLSPFCRAPLALFVPAAMCHCCAEPLACCSPASGRTSVM